MKAHVAWLLLPVPVIATSVFSLEGGVYQMRKDFGVESLGECALEYYYFVPCPTASYFYSWGGWEYEDAVGVWFRVGDVSMGGRDLCDPLICHELTKIAYLDFNTNLPGTYPEDFQFEFDIYCCDTLGCPAGPSVRSSGMITSQNFGWNYVHLDPPLCLTSCAYPQPVGPVILIAATHRGNFPDYPQWGSDAPGPTVSYCANMHEIGCLPVQFPRPFVSYYSAMHSAYYGNGGPIDCPVEFFCDFSDTTLDCSQYGFCELAWTIYFVCSGPTGIEPNTWGGIKSMYR